MNEIICGNNVDVLKTIPDDSIHMMVTSPPYDNLRDYKGFTFNIDELINDIYRTSTAGGIIRWKPRSTLPVMFPRTISSR